MTGSVKVDPSWLPSWAEMQVLLLSHQQLSQSGMETITQKPSGAPQAETDWDHGQSSTLS